MENTTFRLPCMVCNPTITSIDAIKYRTCSQGCYDKIMKFHQLFERHSIEVEPESLNKIRKGFKGVDLSKKISNQNDN